MGLYITIMNYPKKSNIPYQKSILQCLKVPNPISPSTTFLRSKIPNKNIKFKLWNTMVKLPQKILWLNHTIFK